VDGPSREAEWSAWMRAAMRGDAAAYRQFLVAITPHLRSIARYRCGTLGACEGDAEDVVQETLLTIHLKRGTWDQSRPIGPWIAAIVRNKLVDALRRRGRHVVVPIEEVIDTLGGEECAEVLSRGEVDVLLMKLNGRQRDIVQSISIDGSSVRDTARKLNMSEDTVRVALHRALRKLAVLYRSQTSLTQTSSSTC
jgi:RNA polymerase sigma factor (sigma-70 family)